MSTPTVRLAFAALVGLSAAGCVSVADSSAGEELRLMETSREWARAAESGNIDAIVRYWADDAAVMMPGQPTVRGKEAIRRSVAESVKVPGFGMTWEPLKAHVSASGDMGYLLERTQVTAPN